MMSTGKLDKIQLPKHVGDMKSLKNTVSDSFQDICAVGVESFPMINNRFRFDKIHFQISIFKHFSSSSENTLSPSTKGLSS